MLRIETAISVLDRLSVWSIYLLIFALPFSKSIVEITIVTAIICVVLKILLLKEDIFRVKKIENKLLYIFLFVSGLSIFNSYAPLFSVKALFSKSLKFAALFLITSRCIDTRKKLKNFIITASISCAIILIDGLTQYYITHIDFLHSYPSFKYVWAKPLELGAVTASFPFPNDFAAWLLVFIFPIGMYVMFGKGGLKARIFFAFLLAGALYSLAITRVRGAWAAFMLAIGILFFSKLGKMGVVLLAVILLFTLFVNPNLRGYVTSLTSAADRATMWNVGWEIFKEHPIMGNGVNTFFEKFKINRLDQDRGKKGSYAHNCYLQMACDTGLAGLLSFLAFVTALFLKGFRCLKRVKGPFFYSLISGILLGLAAFLLHSAVDTNLYSLPLAALFWLSAGMLMAVVKLAEADI